MQQENQRFESFRMESRTEEITDIIERMPTDFARRITYLVLAIFGTLMLFGFLVKYPDIVSGQIAVSAEQPAIELVAAQSGRLKLAGLKSQDSIKTGQILGWLENSASPSNIESLKKVLKNISIPTDSANAIYLRIPKKVNLGDLTPSYAAFLWELRKLADYQKHKLYDKQDVSLTKVLNEQSQALKTLKEKEELGAENLALSDQFMERYRTLLKNKIISQAEYERALSSRIIVEDQLKTSVRNTGAARENISATEISIQQNLITKKETEQQLDLSVLTTYNSLIHDISDWERQYLIKTPIDGQVQFRKFWSEDHFIKAGEAIFSVVPAENSILGKVEIPLSGAGKVKVGQSVVVKLADFPYLEYGYIEGKVQNIALISTLTENVEGKSVESYMVTISFPNGLVTNYGQTLKFKFETKGTAEIITNDRKLIERFFDNLKYVAKER